MSIIHHIQEHISSARQWEANTGDMRARIRANIHNLHSAIHIGSDNPINALLSFGEDYIDCVPDYLDAFYALSKETGISNFATPFLNLACTYVLNPPDILKPLKGLQLMLAKAYLAHRMMEEVNDKIHNGAKTALAPVDMSTANLIVYSLLGEELADPLDHLVMMAMETLEADRRLIELPEVSRALIQNQLTNWETVLKRWPALNQDFSIKLQV